ncbi:MAG: hypothetical protein RIT27_535 [Pseudomonadota bacterium]|jgi:phosphohistidine phosphatase
MKQLVLIRHAKASHNSLYSHDFDRPLTDRGNQDAFLMAEHFAKKKLSIDKIISSPAFRAKSTAEWFAKSLTIPFNQIVFQPLIYEASTRTLFEIICNLENHWKTVMLVGHNPAFQDIANTLIGKRFFDFPTCAMCGLTFDIENWADLQINSANLVFFETPKEVIP